MKKATKLAEVLESCLPEPLRRDQLDFFVDTSNARDPFMSRREELRQRLERQPGANTKLMLAGHGGCGKSTELVKFADEIAGTFFTVSFSVRQECNPYHVPVEDVLVVMMERLLAACQNAKLALGPRAADKTLKAIHDWFAQELDLEEKETETGGEAAAGLDASRSYLGKVLGLLVKLKGYIRTADKRVHRMTYQKPHRLGGLGDHCNLLIGAVQQALHSRRRRLLVIVEDLDKVDLADARRMLLEQPAVLAKLNTSLICTVPIFMLHSPERGAFEQYFGVVELPMIKIAKRDGSPCPEGRKAVEEIVHRRVKKNLIQADALEMLIDKTGGVLRDVFEVLQVAAGTAASRSAKSKQEPLITVENVRYGLNRRKTEYARAISTIDLPTGWGLSVNDLYAKLRGLRPGPVPILPSEPVSMVLLKARAILEYNGKSWFNLHPLVREILEDMPD